MFRWLTTRRERVTEPLTPQARRRLGSLSTALLLLLVVLEMPRVAAQPEALFEPPASDFGVDPDADGLFDLLRVRVNVIVYEGGMFYLSAALFSGDGSVYIDAAWGTRYLDRSDP